jgi:hypothetical protein
MKKRVLLLVAIIAILLGSTVAGYAYWDNLQQESTGQFDIGYGVRLEVPTKVEDDRALVPAESFYAAYEADYTTSFVFEYTLNLEDILQPGMKANLLVDITNFQVASQAALFNNAASPFTISVATDEVAATQESDGSWTFADEFEFNRNTVVVTVTIELADNGNVNFDSTDYDFIAGTSTDFSIAFELVNSGSSSQPV